MVQGYVTKAHITWDHLQRGCGTWLKALVLPWKQHYNKALKASGFTFPLPFWDWFSCPQKSHLHSLLKSVLEKFICLLQQSGLENRQCACMLRSEVHLPQLIIILYFQHQGGQIFYFLHWTKKKIHVFPSCYTPRTHKDCYSDSTVHFVNTCTKVALKQPDKYSPALL